jgi:hypothetical protein
MALTRTLELFTQECQLLLEVAHACGAIQLLNDLGLLSQELELFQFRHVVDYLGGCVLELVMPRGCQSREREWMDRRGELRKD